MTINKFILAICLIFVSTYCLGQVNSVDLFAAQNNVESNKSITRAWKNRAQITYIEDIEYDPYDASTIVSSAVKFVYYDPQYSTYQVAEFDNRYWPRVTDMEILNDTLYFCGYANIAASSASPHYVGYIGYFCIPQLFSGTDVIHTLLFNPQPYDPAHSPDIYINEPCKLEVFQVDNGIHLVCTGGWSNTSNSLANTGCFVADVAHSFATNDWWYYIHLDYGMEQFTDIAVTDHYVVTVAPKINHRVLYMRIFTKPQHVDLNLTNNNSDPSIFDETHRTPPYQSYCFVWANEFDTIILPNPSVIAYPHVIHTNGDTFAIAYLTYAWNGRHEYGPVVKVIDIADMLHVTPNNSGSGGTPVIVDPPSPPNDPGTPLLPTGPDDPGTGNNPDPNPPSNTSDTVHLYYNRYIDLQNHAQYSSPINILWAIKSMTYDSVKHRILLLERQSYAPGFLDDNIAIDAFNIQSPTTCVERYNLQEPDLPLYSLSGGLNAGEFCISGNSVQNVTTSLLLGMIRMNTNNCINHTDTIPTRYHSGAIEDIINIVNNNPAFTYQRTQPTATPNFFPAFSSNMSAINIRSYEIEDVCNP